jgi:hypothetical protein
MREISYTFYSNTLVLNKSIILSDFVGSVHVGFLNMLNYPALWSRTAGQVTTGSRRKMTRVVELTNIGVIQCRKSN